METDCTEIVSLLKEMRAEMIRITEATQKLNAWLLTEGRREEPGRGMDQPS